MSTSNTLKMSESALRVPETGEQAVTGTLESQQHQTILQEAQNLIYGDREKQYGNPADNFEKIAQVWSVILGVPITPHQVTLLMAGLKLVRLSYKKSRDSAVDLCGYVALLERL